MATGREHSVESEKKPVRSVGNNTRRFATLTLALGLLLTAGCKSPETRVRPVGAGPERSQPQSLTIGQSVEGRPMECVVFGDGPDVILFLSTIHGNEPAGTPLLHRLADHLVQQPQLLNGRQVVLLPLANPDGMARGQRHNVHGVDLNRNFPASNFENGSHTGSSALSEPESTAVHRLIGTFHPGRIVSLHQPANEGNACIDYDGPADALARAMAARCDLPVKQLGCRSGSLGSYAGLMLGIPIVTVELPKDAGTWAPGAIWDRYGQMLLAAIVFSQSASGGPAGATK
ncbi:MAG TPA: DUF2817 domain-containing protein [Phycisphaerae bacterium]|nr:DUF2817 domain-containing protein [Phycisphaerae bacterium]